MGSPSGLTSSPRVCVWARSRSRPSPRLRSGPGGAHNPAALGAAGCISSCHVVGVFVATGISEHGRRSSDGVCHMYLLVNTVKSLVLK